MCETPFWTFFGEDDFLPTRTESGRVTHPELLCSVFMPAEVTLKLCILGAFQSPLRLSFENSEREPHRASDNAQQR